MNIKSHLLKFCFFLLPTAVLSQQKIGGEIAAVKIFWDNPETGISEQKDILYEDDKVSFKLIISESMKDWQEFNYCYVFYFDAAEKISLIYPLSHVKEIKFPQLDINGKIVSTYNLVTNARITAPFGKEKLVLLMTKEPLQRGPSIFQNEEVLTRTQAQTQKNTFRDDLLKLIKGSKLNTLNNLQYSEFILKTFQIETRPKNEKYGLVKDAVVASDQSAGLSKKTVFYSKDSSEIFSVPIPQFDIVRDSFPIIDIIDPKFEKDTRGIEILPSSDFGRVLIRGIAADRINGIKSVEVDEREPLTFRKASGYFDYLYELKEGLNISSVSVENEKGYKHTIQFKFNYTALKNQNIGEGRNYLMVIGIDNYAGFQELHNAKKDAKDFMELMISDYGYQRQNVIDLFDEHATRKIIYSKLKKFVDSLSRNDRLLIYYSGHGFYDSKLEMGFWLPVNAKENEYDDYLGNLDLTRFIQKMNAKNIFVIADACYSGSLLRDMQKENSHDYKSRMVLCSGKLQPVPDGVPGTNSPFATKVLEFFRNSTAKQLLASDLIQFVKKSVPITSNQKPIGGAVDEVGDENGDFIFEKKK